MSNCEPREPVAIDLGKASIETKGAAGFEIDVSNGLLAVNSVLDRGALERAFEVDTPQPGSTVYRLLDIAEAENWARSWI